MVDLIKATCSDGKVTSGGHTVKADIAGAGKAESTGVAVLIKDGALYIPLDAVQDLIAVIEQIVNSVGAIGENISNAVIGAVINPTSFTTITPGPGAAIIQQACADAKTALNELKDNLK
jgi:hypothetical protein